MDLHDDGSTFAEEIPEIEQFVRFDVFNQQLIWYDGGNILRIISCLLILPSLIFSPSTFIKGDPSTALTRPKSVVITEEKADCISGTRIRLVSHSG